MTGTELRELDAEIAYHLFGWRWFRSKKRGLCGIQPPESDGWQRSPWGPSAYDEVDGIPPGSERYTDWDHGGIKELADGKYQHGLPRFSTLIEAAWQVVEKTSLLSEGRVLHCTSGIWCIQEYGPEHGTGPLGGWGPCVQAETAPLAICRAALASVRSHSSPSLSPEPMMPHDNRET